MRSEIRIALLFGCLLWLLSPLTIEAQIYFNNPESAACDSVRNRYFVSNVGNGNITQIDFDGTTSYYYTGFSRAMGLLILGDTMYVAANTGLVAFDLTTDEVISTTYIPYQIVLNDVTADTSGYLYVTDSGRNRIFRVNISDLSTSTAVNYVYWPNGIMFDEQNNRVLFCSFGNNVPIRAINPANFAVSTVVSTAFQDLDGLTVDNEGYIYVSSWGSNAVYRYDRDFNNPPEQVTGGNSGPADIFFDRQRNVLVIPNFNRNTVDFVEFPDTDEDGLIDLNDNCPAQHNPAQEDTDNDGIGNACDNCPEHYDPSHTDADADGFGDVCDNCVEYYNPGQQDSDSDGVGDSCDNCREVHNSDQADSNDDGVGDACCCIDIRGNVDDDPVGLVDLGDLTRLIDYLFISFTSPGCVEEANVDGSLDNVVDLSDLTALIDFLFVSFTPPADCPE